MSNITNFNRFCSNTEDILSSFAAIPIIGTPFAICKLALGTIQTITALALGILSLPFRFCSDDAAAFNNHCWTHVVHGLGNIVASIFEAIPFGGFSLSITRSQGQKITHRDNPEHQDKYIPYADVIEENKRAIKNLAGNNPQLYKILYTDHLYEANRGLSRSTPTHFRQATGFNAIVP